MIGSFDLPVKLALVTGGASGIGIGITEMLAEAGAHVVVIDRNGEAAEAQAAALRGAGHAASAQAIDVADEASVIAGVQDRQYLLDEDVAGWERAMAVNARGPFLMTREAGRARRWPSTAPVLCGTTCPPAASN